MNTTGSANSKSELTADLKIALGYWRALGGESLSCSWKQFDLPKIPTHLLPTTMVVDVHPDMDDNIYRFWGTMMTRIHGRDMTGQSPYDLEPADLARSARKVHAEIIEKRTWNSVIHTFIRHSGVKHRHCALRLPLSDDGQTISHLVVVVDVSIADPKDRRDLLTSASV